MSQIDPSKLFAPDVVEKDGKYYLYAYIENQKGCVAVSDKPEGPFKFLSTYTGNLPEGAFNNGIFIDPGVLVDDDGKVYIYCGFLKSEMAEINPDNMHEVIEGSVIEDFIPSKPRPEDGFDTDDKCFFEAASMRKVGDTYYMIYRMTARSWHMLHLTVLRDLLNSEVSLSTAALTIRVEMTMVLS